MAYQIQSVISFRFTADAGCSVCFRERKWHIKYRVLYLSGLPLMLAVVYASVRGNDISNTECYIFQVYR